MIKVKLLHPGARVPSVNYSGHDLGFDLYAVEDVVLEPGVPVKVRTGIAVEGPTGMGFVWATGRAWRLGASPMLAAVSTQATGARSWFAW